VPSSRRSSSARRAAWTRLPDEKLLDLRLNQLALEIEGSALESRVERLHEELEAKGLRFRPHCWLSSEWFSPSGVTGFAIPFYLAHPRLKKLERRRMLQVEGDTLTEFMQLMRHECGHAIDCAFRLHHRASWRKVFGRFSKPYHAYYKPTPFSRDFVRHLPHWYAQSHPAEDFCETFAVWLQPRSRWRKTYDGWPAKAKLEYVAETMKEIAGRRPPVNCRDLHEPLSSLKTTLRRYYERKQDRYTVELPNVYDQDLKQLFSLASGRKGREPAAAFLRRHRADLREGVEPWTRESLFTIDQVLGKMIERSRKLRLCVNRSERETLEHASVILAVHTMNYIHSGHTRYAR
jgi:hypothetical protein